MKKIMYRLAILCSFLVPHFITYAQVNDEAIKSPPKVYEAEPVYIILAVICLLAVIIAVMAKVFVTAAKYRVERDKQQNSGLPILIFMLLLLPFGTCIAQAPKAIQQVYFSEITVQVLLFILGLELLIIVYLAYHIQGFLKAAKLTVAKESTSISLVKKSWLEKLYKQNTAEEILQLDLGHNYDGIRELDNNIPIWWKLGFALSIVFAVSYLYGYHVAHSKPLQQEELRIDMAMAAEQHSRYLEQTANNIDEKNVTMLGKEDIESGKALFIKPGACATCHGENGSGIVNGLPGIGPNLADDYWLHKGDINAIFYSIKYGWPEKGMKAWQEDYSPKQIAQLASFVKSLQGSDPKPAKEPQGIVFKETAPSSDSVVNK